MGNDFVYDGTNLPALIGLIAANGAFTGAILSLIVLGAIVLFRATR